MSDLLQYILSEAKSKRLPKDHAIALIRQYQAQTANKSAVLHPLLHRNLSDLTGLRFVSTFSGAEFFLADHRVNGRRVLPGVAYLEMARAAVMLASGAGLEGTGVTLKNVVWSRPLLSEEQPVDVQMALFEAENGEIAFEVSTLSGGEKPVRTLHSQGVAMLGASAARPDIDLAATLAQCNLGRVTADECYAAFRQIGLDYGPGHRCIGQIHIGKDQVLAELALAAGVGRGYVLDPGMLDSALQATLGLFYADGKGEAKAALPFALNELQVFSACTAKMWALVRRSPGSLAGDPVQKLDIDLVDQQGKLCVRFGGFASRMATGTLDADAARIGTLVWQAEWRAEAVDIPVEAAAVADGQQELVILCGVLGGDPGASARIAQALAGTRCLRPLPPEGFPELEFYAQQVFDEVRQILQAKPSGQVSMQIVVPASGAGQALFGLAALLKTAQHENPKLSGQVIGIEDGESVTGLIAKLQENRHAPHQAQIRYLDRQRWVRGWKPLAARAVEMPWRADGVYLVTGGAGGVGLIFAKEILRQAPGAKLILTGRSAFTALGMEKQAQLQPLGGPLCYRQVDCADQGAVSALIGQIQQDFGGLNGIIHGAGVMRDNFILKKDAAEFCAVLAPKVAGLLALDQASKDLALDFLVCFSSTSGAHGNAGQADYAFANAFMDAFAGYRNGLLAQGERRGRTLSINWPLWEEGGMHVDAATLQQISRQTGMIPLRSASGIDAFYQALASGGDQVLVMEGVLAQMRQIQESLEKLQNRQRIGAALKLTRPAADAGGIGADALQEKAENYLKKLLASVLKMPSSRIDAQASLDTYGIDSIMAMQLTVELEGVFGALSKTLFFEYQTIEALAAYFIEQYRGQLLALLNIGQGSAGKNQAASAPPLAEAPAAPEAGKRRSHFAAAVRKSQSDPDAPAMPGMSGTPAGTQTAVHGGFDEIAIIGLSGRYPQARDLQAYWQNLSAGKDCISEIPPERWDHSLYYDADKTKLGKTYGKWGGFIDGVDQFDPQFFNISPREAEIMDPQERLFLQCVVETIEDAGYTRETLTRQTGFGQNSNVGVYVGVMYEEYQLYGAQEQSRGRNFAVPGSPASIANRVSYFCNFHGPSMALDTMCSSSLTAIHLACDSLQRGGCDLAIAGGVNVSIHPNKFLMLGQGRFISSKGRCESFGVGGDGYVPGEGVGAVLLKPKSKAIADGDQIHGIVKASALNHGGKTNGYTVPNPQAQASVIGRAIKQAGINPRSISYIEAHGTGTSLGDPIEIAGLSKAFQEFTKDRQFCALGSAKANIGHCESAAGIAGLTKILLQMKHRQLAPSLHSTVLNPNIDFANTPFVVQQELAEWKRPILDIDGVSREYPRIAGLSSFGAGGANAHLVIEEYIPAGPDPEPAIHDAEHPALIVLSARNPERLQDRARQLLAAIGMTGGAALGDGDLADIAYTLQVGREAMEERLAILAVSIAELSQKLQALLAGEDGVDDLFQGQVKRNKEIFGSGGLLGADDDIGLAIDAWITKGKYAKLLDLWTKGLIIDWNKLYRGARPRRISLPTYPFATEHYWLPDLSGLLAQEALPMPAATPPAAAPVAVALAPAPEREEAHQEMCFEEVWQEQALPEAGGAPIRTLVCFASDTDNQREIQTAINALSAQTRVVFISRHAKPLDDALECHCVEADDGAAYRRLFETLRGQLGAVDAMLYLWPLEDAGAIREYRPIVSILQAISSAQLDVKRILLAAQAENALDSCYIDSWIGFERSIKLVLPVAKLAVVHRSAGSEADGLALWTNRLWAELQAPGAPSVRYDKDARLASRMRERAMAQTSLASALRSGGTYLISAGAEGLGFLFSRYLAKTHAANLVLIGASPLDAAGLEKIAELEALGGQALYLQADLCERQQLQEALALAKARFGRICGVIHAAGAEGKDSLLNKEYADFSALLAPRIDGTLALEAALEQDAPEAPDFICYFTSSSAVLGDFGSCDYAIGNRFQMAYADYRVAKKLPGKTVAILWPLWKEGATDQSDQQLLLQVLQSGGQRLLESAAGLALFEQLLARPETQTLVLTGRPSRVRRFLGMTEASASPSSSPSVQVAQSAAKGRRPEMRGLSVAQCVEWDLKQFVSDTLKIPRDKIAMDDNMSEFGFDSISLTGFAATLTQHYGIEVSPALFFDYPSVAQLAQYYLREHAAQINAHYRENRPEQSAPAPVRPTPTVLDQAGYGQTAAAAPMAPPSGHGASVPGDNQAIAIIGIGGRFPQARDVDQLWAILSSGRDVVQAVDAERQGGWQNSKHRCGFVPGISEFDPLFFEISPREAQGMDPRQRLLLQEAWNALEDAGYGQEQIQGGRLGMFVGVEDGEYQVLNGFESVITANHNGILAARLAYFLNTHGPVMAINTACSSGLVAAHQACQSLRNRECDTALAAGVNLMITPMAYIGLERAGMLSADGKCYAFDERANGMVPGEAVAVVVLKRLAEAEADGDPIHATIIGSGINFDGKTQGITAPNGVAQAELIKSVYEQYRVDPEQIDYIVTHGTGTKLGDPIEVNALRSVFAGRTKKQGFCALTSTKGNLGHSLAASGLVSLISLVQALRHHTIPASLNCERENTFINWKNSPFYVNKANQEWLDQPGRPRTGAVSAFGMSGTNAHMLVQSHVPKARNVAPSVPYYLLALSAKTGEALQQRIGDLLGALGKADAFDLATISNTLLNGRQHFQHRCAVVIQDHADAIHLLKQFGGKEALPNLFQGKPARNFAPQKAMQHYAQEMLRQSGTAHSDPAKYQENLFALADLYCQGYPILWGDLFGTAKPARAHLPGYPFAKTHYWVEETGFSAAAGKDQAAMLHPLLQRNTSDLLEQRYSSVFTGSELFLADHIVNGQPFLPGVAYLEMARVAGLLATGKPVDGSVPVRLKNVLWLRPLVVQGGPVELHIGLYPETGDSIAYQFYTQAQGAEPVVHSQGVISMNSEDARQDQADRLDIPLLQGQCAQGLVSGEECYAGFKHIGLAYGPSHQGIRALHLGGEQVLAQLSLPAALVEIAQPYGLHPGIMDSALQAAAGLFLNDKAGEPTLAVPFALQEIDVLAPCGANMWALVKRSAGSAGSQEGGVQAVDIDVCDQDGRICARLKGFASRVLRVPQAAAPAPVDSPDAIGPLLLQPEWAEAAVDPAAAVPEYAQRLILLCGDGIAPQQIEAALAPARCLRLGGGETGLAQEFGESAQQILHEIQQFMRARAAAPVLIQILVPGQGVRQTLAGLSGMLKTAQQESPKLMGQVIAIEADATLADAIAKLQENRLTPKDAQIRYLDGRRQVAVWRDIAMPAPSIPWRADGVYLITGGAGGLGLLFAREILQRAPQARVVLSGRSALSAEKQELLQTLGGQLSYRQTDIADMAEVTQLMLHIGQEFGGLNGIIHSAGVIRDNMMLKKTPDQLHAVLAPKVAGLLNLDHTSKDFALDHLICFSSISGALGNSGQADYAAANAFMDAYAGYRNSLVARGERQGHTLSVNWPLWRDGGMHVDPLTEKMMIRHTGMIPLGNVTGIDGLYRALASRQDQVMLLEGNLARMRQKFVSAKPLPAPAPMAVPIAVPATPAAPAAERQAPVANEFENVDLLAKVTRMLSVEVSNLLKVAVEDIDVDSEMSEYGFDSISLTEFGQKLNQDFQIEVAPTIFFEHSTLNRFAQHLVKEHRALFAAKFAPQGAVRQSAAQSAAPGAQPAASGAAAIGAQPARPARRARFADGVAATATVATRQAEPIAIIGMSCCFPMAANVDEYWQNLLDGKDCIGEIPKSRWDWQEHYGDPATEVNKTNIKWGGFIDGIEHFDSLFFGIAPKEAPLMDPQQRLLMTHIWKTMEDAGYSAASLAGGNTAIFAGTGGSGYSALIAMARIPIEGFSSTGMVPSLGPNRMSFFLDLHGPSQPVETACSSALVALRHGVHVLDNGECDMAFVGGVNIIVTPDAHIAFGKAGMLAVDGRCKTFSEQANGYVRGEGIGMLLLKRLSGAEADGDHIYGLIRGTSENHGGRANSLTAPNPAAQSNLVKAAYLKAQVDPRSIGFIEAHGTGTGLGDPVEVNGLKTAFKELYAMSGDPEVKHAHCGLGSAKSNIGHLEMAAGVAGVIKVLLQMKHKTLVKTLHCEEVNSYIDLRSSPFYILQQARPWLPLQDAEGRDLPRRAGVSSFGFGGVNAHVVIEEYQARADGPSAGGTGAALIVLSAKNRERLQERAQQLLAAIQSQALAEADLPSIAYTLQIGRDAMEERLGLSVASLDELRQKLSAVCAEQKNIEGVHRGQVRGNKEAVAIFAADEDLAKAIDVWFVKGKYDKLLELWVKGLALDWNKLYVGQKPKRISLPSYPFAKTRHWVTPAGDGAPLPHAATAPLALAVAPVSDMAPAKAAVAAVAQHPFLQQNTSQLSTPRFSNSFSGAEFFLADHRVRGERVLPGVAYLEMARAAAMAAHGKPVMQGNGVRLTNVIWMRPMSISASAFENKQALALHITLKAQDDGGFSYEIQSDSADDGALTHSQGVVGFGGTAAADATALDIPALQAACRDAVVPGELCYDLFASGGLQYGPGQRAVEALYVGKGQVLAKLHLPPSVADTLGQYVLHPSLMDAALQACLGLSIGEGQPANKTRLPFALQSLDVLRPCCARMWASVRYSPGAKAGDDVQLLDIDLCDQDGGVCVQMRGFASRELGSAPPPRARTGDAGQGGGQLLLSAAWDVATPALGPLTPSAQQRLLVVGADDAWKTALAADFPQAQILDIAPGADIEAIVASLGALREAEFGPIGHILWIAAADAVALDDDAMIAAQQRGVLRLFRFVKALLALNHGDQDLGWTVITQGTQASHPGQALNPAHAGIHGLIGSLAKEYANWQIRLVDLAGDGQLPAELFRLPADPAGDAWVWRGGQWYRRQLLPCQITPGQTPLYRSGGVYVVIGGAGGLGEVWSEFMISRHGAQIVWIGRRPCDQEIQGKLDRLAKIAAPAGAMYVQADATERASLQAAYQQIKQRHPRIHGVIHSAIVLQDKTLENMDEPRFCAALAAKVDVSVRMAQVFAAEALDFVLFFSSTQSFTKSAGQGNYAAGCAFKDAFAHQLGQTWTSPVKLMNWGYWGSVGVAASKANRERLAQVGIGSVEPEEAMAALSVLLDGPLNQIAFFKTSKPLNAEMAASNGLQGIAADQVLLAYPAAAPMAAATESPAAAALLQAVQARLLTWSADLLKVDGGDINVDSDFGEYSSDPVLLDQLVQQVNQEYALSLIGADFLEQATLRRFAQFLLERHPESLGRAQQPEPQPQPQQQPASAVASQEAIDCAARQDQLGGMLCKMLWSQFKAAGLFAEDGAATRRQIKQQLGVIDAYDNWLEQSLRALERQGYIALDGDACLAIDDAPVVLFKAWEEWRQGTASLPQDGWQQARVRLAEAMLHALPDILSGKLSAVDVIYPDASARLVDGLYKDDLVAAHFDKVLADALRAYLQQCLPQDPSARLRVLEVGAEAGTAGAVFEALKPFQTQLQEYCHSGLADTALRKFDTGLSLAQQQIDAGGYDVVIVGDLSRAAKNIRTSLRNCKAALRQNGLLLLSESKGGGDVFTHLTFGLLADPRVVEDSVLRIPGSLGLSAPTWEMLLEQEGFGAIRFPAQAGEEFGRQVVAAHSDGIVRQPRPRPQQPMPASASASNAETAAAASGSAAAQEEAPDIEGLMRELRGLPAEERQPMLVDSVRTAIAVVLGMEPSELDPLLPLSDFGLDSLMAIKFRSWILQNFKVDIPVTHFLSSLTVDELVVELLDSIDSMEAGG